MYLIHKNINILVQVRLSNPLIDGWIVLELLFFLDMDVVQIGILGG